jgi:NhaA family Na+:H+ antiporter
VGEEVWSAWIVHERRGRTGRLNTAGSATATLAGVAMGLLAPARPGIDHDQVHAYDDDLLDVSTAETAQETVMLARSSVSVVERLVYTIHPWSSFAIVPVFALANTGVELSADLVGDAVSSRVALGVLVGLVVGKPLGILLFSWLACRVGLPALPTGAGWASLAGTATLAGIGFTLSLFIADLAFTDSQLVDQATLGILAASALASGLGALVLHRTSRSGVPARVD